MQFQMRRRAQNHNRVQNCTSVQTSHTNLFLLQPMPLQCPGPWKYNCSEPDEKFQLQQCRILTQCLLLHSSTYTYLCLDGCCQCPWKYNCSKPDEGAMPAPNAQPLLLSLEEGQSEHTKNTNPTRYTQCPVPCLRLMKWSVFLCILHTICTPLAHHLHTICTPLAHHMHHVGLSLGLAYCIGVI